MNIHKIYSIFPVSLKIFKFSTLQISKYNGKFCIPFSEIKNIFVVVTIQRFVRDILTNGNPEHSSGSAVDIFQIEERSVIKWCKD